MHPDAPPGTEPEDLASQARRRHAFGEVVEPEIEVLLRVARSLTGAESDAEDLVQETLIRAFGALDRFDGRHPRAWLLTILRRTHLNMHRRRRPSTVGDWEVLRRARPAFGSHQQPSAEDSALTEDLDPALHAAMAALDERFRAAVVLVDVHDLSYADAAAVLDVPIGTVMSRLLGTAAVLTLLASGCAAPAVETSVAADRPWEEVLAAAEGQTVDLWMWGGDERGNAYVDDVLAPAAAELGVTLRRVPVADTRDAVRRVLAERAAGEEDGTVDLVWVNGDNFATGREAGAWACGWAGTLPHAAYLAEDDPLVAEDFGVPTEGCESPWHKAQFAFVYDQARVEDPPTSLSGLLDWAEAHPGRFTYPAPPDFTGSVFVRHVLHAVAGEEVPGRYDEDAAAELTPALWQRLREVAPSLWREGRTYPRDSVALDRLFASGEVDLTMTYGPATLTELVADGTFPESTRVLELEDGTIGNASFLAMPATAGDPEGAMVVADLALSPEQQALKADPGVWGQFTVLDLDLLEPADRARFEELPASPVVPPYEELSRDARPELASDWVAPLDDGWRREVVGRR